MYGDDHQIYLVEADQAAVTFQLEDSRCQLSNNVV